MKERKNYNQWIHANIVLDKSPISKMQQGVTTLCGKTARRIISTTDVEEVTCLRCKKIIDEQV